MPVSKKIASCMKKSSWIRKMFEEGARMKADGKGAVFDFSLGNPDLEPPLEFSDRLLEIVSTPMPGSHKYMPNPGYVSTRRTIAENLDRQYELPFTENHVLMSVGAGGGLNVCLKALLDAGDEVIVFSPYFVEYRFYIDNAGGSMVLVPTTKEFDIDIQALAEVLSPKTKAVLINSPNNPTGVVYSRETLEKLGDLLRNQDHPIYLLSDEPYRKIIYDIDYCPSIFDAYELSICITSHSKDLGLPGERIGYIAISPNNADAADLFNAMAFTTRTLGFVNAPALMQRTIEKLQHVTVDLEWYQRKRDLLYRRLTSAGYHLIRPQGAFYMFPEAPGGDDIAFTRFLAERRILVVPGSGFGTPGYFRLAYCVHDYIVEAAIPIFEQAILDYSR